MPALRPQPLHKVWEERSIYGVIGYRLPTHRDGYFYKREYRYDEKLDVYICPNGQLLTYRTTNREGNRQYHSDADKCANCPVRQKCTQSANLTKVVTRHVWEASRECIDQHRLSRVGKRIYKRRKETGASFADKPHPKDGVRQQSGAEFTRPYRPVKEPPVAKQIHR